MREPQVRWFRQPRYTNPDVPRLHGLAERRGCQLVLTDCGWKLVGLRDGHDVTSQPLSLELIERVLDGPR